MIHGKRELRYYSIMVSELRDLFALSILAAGCWLMAGISIGFAVASRVLGLVDVPMTWGLSLIFLVVGVIFLVQGKLIARAIKRESK